MEEGNHASQQALRGKDVTTGSLPNCCFLTIAKHGVTAYRVVQKKELTPSGVESSEDSKATDIPPSTTEIEFQKTASWSCPDVAVAEFSPSGDLLGVATKEESLKLIDPKQQFQQLATLDTGPIKKLMFSPKSTYAAVLTPYAQTTNEKNVKVYNLLDHSLVVALTVKGSAAQERWPPLVWSNNEFYCFRMLANEVQVFPGNLAGFPTPSTRITEEKIEAFSPCVELKENQIHVAVFMSGTRDKPATVKVFLVESLRCTPVPVNHKSFFFIQEILFHWNYTGTAVLAVGHTDVDRSGKSYYGTSCLYYLEAKHEGQALQVIGSDIGPVLDCQWFPLANEFIVIFGPMPPSIRVYDGRTAESKLSLGEVHRNICRLNPFGRFILVAGFGNLAGDFDVWDRNKKKIIGSGKADCAVDCSWAPNGRLFLCATTTPRMRVDNHVEVFRYNGDLLGRLDIPDLYFAKWMPASANTYPDRGASRGRPVGSRSTIGTEVYRPPGAPQNLDSRLRLRLNEAQTTAVVTKSGELPIGAEFVQPMTKSSKKNAARKAKKQREAANLP